MINTDKILHFIILVIFVAMCDHSLSFIVDGWSKPTSFILGMVLALAKEEYDRRNKEKHTSDGADFIASIVGILTYFELSDLINANL